MCVLVDRGLRLTGEIRPAPHQTRAVHVDQRVRDVQVFGDELTEERLVRLSEALMQIVHMAVSGVPAACRQVGEPLEPQRDRLREARLHVNRDGRRLVLKPAERLDLAAPAGTSSSASPSV